MKLWLLSCLFAFASITASAHDMPMPAKPGFKHLSFQNGTIHAHTQFEKGPQTPDESVLRIDWKNGADHSPMNPAGFTVSLFMPDMGHGSSPVTITPVKSADGKDVLGSYRVTAMYFTMGGDWEVRVTLKTADGKQETQIIPVSLPEGDMGDMPGMGH